MGGRAMIVLEDQKKLYGEEGYMIFGKVIPDDMRKTRRWMPKARPLRALLTGKALLHQQYVPHESIPA